MVRSEWDARVEPQRALSPFRVRAPQRSSSVQGRREGTDQQAHHARLRAARSVKGGAASITLGFFFFGFCVGARWGGMGEGTGKTELLKPETEQRAHSQFDTGTQAGPTIPGGTTNLIRFYGAVWGGRARSSGGLSRSNAGQWNLDTATIHSRRNRKVPAHTAPSRRSS